MPYISNEILRAAETGLEAQLLQTEQKAAAIREQLADLRTHLTTNGASATPPTDTEPTKKRKGMSAQARHNMALAQQKRYAEAKKRWAQKEAPPIPEAPAPKKRTISVAGRKAISKATKARWARQRAEKAANMKAMHA